MPATVLLKDIVDALQMQFDESISFLDLETGQVETVSRELLGMAEESDEDDDEPDLLAWQEDEWETAKRIASTGSFVRLPTEFDVHEWEIMQDFALPGARRHSQRSLARHPPLRRISAFQAHRSPSWDRAGLVCISRRGAAANRARLVRRASHPVEATWVRYL